MRRSGRRPGMAMLLLAAVSALAVGGCLPRAATAEGRQIGELYDTFLVASGVVLLIVYGLATWALLRYRRRRREALPPQIEGSNVAEFVWSAVPLLTVAALFVLTAIVLSRVDWDPRTGGPPPDPGAPAASGPPVELEVTAYRWGWRFRFPDTGREVSSITGEAAEIALPVGRPVRVTLTASDVVHAFYVPQFLFKKDATPGHASTFMLTIEEPGTYGGQCAEFCGTYHARMPFTIRAVSEAEFSAWLAGTARGAEADR